MISPTLQHFAEHSVGIALDARLIGNDAAKIHADVSAARAAMDLDAEREALVASLPEAVELGRLRERLAKAKTDAVERAADEAAADGKWSAAVVNGDKPNAKLLASRESAKTAAAQSREIVSALENAITFAESDFTAAATRANERWRNAELDKAQQAESAALAAVEAIVAQHAADFLKARNRFDALRTLRPWDFVPEDRPPEVNRWAIQNRKHIVGNLSLPAGAGGLSSFAVETVSETHGASE